ncbi:sensor histidine kinase [Streptomyces sp. NPDC048644]|uniref:sensor histidine kinase n=1 Tax=Streptomyces sp. NPDC048644 TaxID=3365582 RepID=UPI003711EDC0
MPPQPPSRHQAARSPLGDALLTLPAALLVSGGLCLWAVLTAPDTVRTPLAWCGGAAAVLLSAAVTVAVHGQRQSRRHLAEADAVRAEADAVRAEAELLADETLPALVDRLRDGASADTALGRTAQPANAAHRRIMRTLAVEVGRGERMRAAAMSACANAAGRVQALATGMLADLREMENRHGEEVLGDLLRLDHSTAQAGRLADSIAVLTGARSGRRWNKPIAMESILRGAMGRISAYRRVQLHNSSTAAVAGHAAEGIMHALAEVMDNAASFSPPTSPVHVYVEEAQAGVVVSVEDSGLVMSETALRRAESAVSAATLDLMSLSGTRLGLAVVGCLARKHGLHVSFRPSARGGTGVVVLIPQQLITEARPAGRDAVRDTVHEAAPAPGPQAVRAPSEPVAPVAPSAPAAPPAPVAPPAPAAPTVPPQAARATPAPEFGESGLPKRRRGQTLGTTAPSGTGRAPAARPATPRPARSREEAAERFRTFRRAVQGTPAPGDPTPAPDGPPASPPAPAPARPEDDIR